MSDDAVVHFQVRRPMLQHVADALREEIGELLADEGLRAQVAFSVSTAEEYQRKLIERSGEYQAPLVEMPDQIFGQIEMAEFEDISRLELLIAELLTVHSSRWLASERGLRPQHYFTCIIPPQAMPEGWKGRNDVPTAFQLVVRATEGPSEPKTDLVPVLSVHREKSATFPLVMKGGGIKGLAYVGAIEELSTRYRFNWFVGTSAGAITAILLGAGYTPQELRDILLEKDFRDFFDAAWFAQPFNIVFYRGLHHSDSFTSWLDELLARKLNSHTRVRLSHLPYRVTVYASRRGRRTLKFDSVDNDADAAYAARCSMSIPYVFTPQTDQGINTYDGGIHQNYPIEQLLKDHPNASFISLFLGSEVYEPIRQRFVFLDLFSIWTEGADADAVAEYRLQTVVIDPRPIGTLDFELSAVEKEYLIACGRAGAHAHLDRDSAAHISLKNTRDQLRSAVEPIRSRRSRRRWMLRIASIVLLVGASYVLFAYCL